MSEKRNTIMDGASLLYQMAPGMYLPFEYEGIRHEITAYPSTAWIGTTLMISPIYDIVGPDANAFMNSICVNDFTNLGMTGLRHAVICNEKGQILTDGVAIKVAEDRIRTYWLNPPIEYMVQETSYNVHGEDMTGKEYFIQVQGEKSLEILENALEANLHDIRFAKHRIQCINGREVNVIRLGMTGNLAYEIHGPIADFEYIYDKVWQSGEKFGAKKLGMVTYNYFNHTEAGFPNINLHYPLPWFESGEGLANFLYQRPMQALYNIKRELTGSVGDDLESRFVTPYDTGIGFLIKFNHDFPGKAALEKMKDHPARTCVTLEWNAEDVGKVFAASIDGSPEPVDYIYRPTDIGIADGPLENGYRYRADKVFAGDKMIGITSGRIISFTHHTMISLAFISPEYAGEGTELEILWGSPNTRQMRIRAKVAKLPYNSEVIRNENRNVDDIPVYKKAEE